MRRRVLRERTLRVRLRAYKLASTMLNSALPLSARPINFWEARQQKENHMATTQQPVRRAFAATKPCFGANWQTPEKLIASQKPRDLSASSLAAGCSPLFSRYSVIPTLDLGHWTSLWTRLWPVFPTGPPARQRVSSQPL